VSVENGNIDVDLAGLGPPGVSLHSTNGLVSVTGFDDASYTTNTGTNKVGTLGAGEATITLRATNGNILIQSR